MTVFLIIGAIGFFISGISIGAWTDGRQYRVHFEAERKEERNFRLKTAMISGLVGLLSFGVAGLLYVL